jgi:hypothetical protein
MVVELDIFSGRPNPQWQLSEDLAAQVVRLLESLELAASHNRPNPPGLGYRGFRLSDPGGLHYWAYGGLVVGGTTVLADPTRMLERFLLEHLPEEYADLRPLIESAIGPG